MANIFDTVAKKLRGSPVILMFFWVAFAMLGLGIVFFIEDTKSSFDGIRALEETYNIKPINYQITYFAISIAPQIATLGLSYLYLTSEKRNKWILVGVFMFQLVDFLSDLQDRSGGQFVAMTADGIHLSWSPAIAFAAFFTIVYYTIGSEVFLSVSIALILALFPDAVMQYVRTFTKSKAAIRAAKRDIKAAHEQGRQQPKQKKKPNGQRVSQRGHQHNQHNQHNQRPHQSHRQQR